MPGCSVFCKEQIVVTNSDFGYIIVSLRGASNQALGTIGSAPRAICCGPGINNFDFAIHKNTLVNERMNVQFRAEFFNIWNHAQFFPPDGNITDGSTFGQISKARDPRLIQFALKFLF